MKTRKFELNVPEMPKMPKVFGREPPDWQTEKLILAREIVSQLKELNGKLDLLIVEYKRNHVRVENN